MRAFKDITKEELIAKVDETFYYYLISDLVESSNAGDKEAAKEALDIMKTCWAKRDELTKSILETVERNCEPDDSYSDFEDSLFEATEHEIY